jgi:hypothetical protein
MALEPGPADGHRVRVYAAGAGPSGAWAARGTETVTVTRLQDWYSSHAGVDSAFKIGTEANHSRLVQ